MLSERANKIQILSHVIDYGLFEIIKKKLEHIYRNYQITRKNIFRFMFAEHKSLHSHDFAFSFFGIIPEKLIMISRVNFGHQHVNV